MIVFMEKQNASMDTSFWINLFRVGLAETLLEYFNIYVSQAVCQEIEYPFQYLNIVSDDALLFRKWRVEKRIRVEKVAAALGAFHGGEAQAIQLAVEKEAALLIDDSYPYFYAKERGIPIVGTPDYTVFLCAEGKLTLDRSRELLVRLRGSVKEEIIAQALNLLDRL